MSVSKKVVDASSSKTSLLCSSSCRGKLVEVVRLVEWEVVEENLVEEGKVVVLLKRVEGEEGALHPSDITTKPILENWLLHCIVL